MKPRKTSKVKSRRGGADEPPPNPHINHLINFNMNPPNNNWFPFNQALPAPPPLVIPNLAPLPLNFGIDDEATIANDAYEERGLSSDEDADEYVGGVKQKQFSDKTFRANQHYHLIEGPQNIATPKSIALRMIAGKRMVSDWEHERAVWKKLGDVYPALKGNVDLLTDSGVRKRPGRYINVVFFRGSAPSHYTPDSELKLIGEMILEDAFKKNDLDGMFIGQVLIDEADDEDVDSDYEPEVPPRIGSGMEGGADREEPLLGRFVPEANEDHPPPREILNEFLRMWNDDGSVASTINITNLEKFRPLFDRFIRKYTNQDKRLYFSVDSRGNRVSITDRGRQDREWMKGVNNAEMVEKFFTGLVNAGRKVIRVGDSDYRVENNTRFVPEEDMGIGSGANAKGLKLLELFKGTGSIGKVAKRKGMVVMSVDLLDKYQPDITADILEWDYKKFHKDTGFVPDLLWASPPCNTFSSLAYIFKERDTKTAKPKSARARQGTAILYRTLEIINYFHKLNPKMLWCMENPRGMMRLDEKVMKLPHRDTTLYCLYDDVRRKPTDFFNNVALKLRDVKTECKGKKLVGVVDLPINERYKIPSKLVNTILNQMVEKYKSGKSGGMLFYADEGLKGGDHSSLAKMLIKKKVLEALIEEWRDKRDDAMEDEEDASEAGDEEGKDKAINRWIIANNKVQELKDDLRKVKNKIQMSGKGLKGGADEEEESSSSEEEEPTGTTTPPARPRNTNTTPPPMRNRNRSRASSVSSVSTDGPIVGGPSLLHPNRPFTSQEQANAIAIAMNRRGPQACRMEARMFNPTREGFGKRKRGGKASNKTLQELAQKTYKPSDDTGADGYVLKKKTKNMNIYVDEGKKEVVVAIKGMDKFDSADYYADLMVPINSLSSSNRFKGDLKTLKEFQEKYPKSEYKYEGVGHSLGGAIMDEFLDEKLLDEGRSYNPAVQPKSFHKDNKNERVYQEGDPLYYIFGDLLSKKPEVRPKKPADKVVELIRTFAKDYPNAAKGVEGVYSAYKEHKLENFVGGNKYNDTELIKNMWVSAINAEKPGYEAIVSQFIDYTNEQIVDEILRSLTAFFQMKITSQAQSENQSVQVDVNNLYKVINLMRMLFMRGLSFNDIKNSLSTMSGLGSGGGAKTHGKFMKQLKKIGLDPALYLKEAQRRAEKFGYPSTLLGFSADAEHKLSIPDADGRLVLFGKVGYGDDIIYSHLVARKKISESKATASRNRFQSSHSKIKGDWKKNPFSPNNLALRILW